MKVEVDHGRCAGLGICESVAPDTFEINDDGDLVVLVETVPPELLDDAERAVEGCPTAALRLVQ